MGTREQDDIRQAVRDNYGRIATAGAAESGPVQTASCCGPAEAKSAEGASSSCCGSSPELDPQGISTMLGYSEEEMAGVPEGANLGLGCGNPLALASLSPGETVVDLGSGGGFDCFLAAKEVGREGRVIGVDMTPDMVSLARRNAEKVEAANVEFRLGEIEHLPLADGSADLIMSNCVINLSPDKQRVYDEAFRVLKPGGRLSISDVLATASLPLEARQDLALISACVGGAETIDETEKILERAGFERIRITTKENSKEIIQEWAPGREVMDYIVSANIEAVKPA